MNLSRFNPLKKLKYFDYVFFDSRGKKLNKHHTATCKFKMFFLLINIETTGHDGVEVDCEIWYRCSPQKKLYIFFFCVKYFLKSRTKNT